MLSPSTSKAILLSIFIVVDFTTGSINEIYDMIGFSSLSNRGLV